MGSRSGCRPITKLTGPPPEAFSRTAKLGANMHLKRKARSTRYSTRGCKDETGGHAFKLLPDDPLELQVCGLPRHCSRPCLTSRTRSASILTASGRSGSVEASSGTGEIDDASPDPDIGNPNGTARHRINDVAVVPAFDWFDLALGYDLTRNVQSSVGVNNLLDQEPPLSRGLAYNPAVNTYAIYDPLGRYLRASLRFNYQALIPAAKRKGGFHPGSPLFSSMTIRVSRSPGTRSRHRRAAELR